MEITSNKHCTKSFGFGLVFYSKQEKKKLGAVSPSIVRFRPILNVNVVLTSSMITVGYSLELFSESQGGV